jgi:hypothetical protein
VRTAEKSLEPFHVMKKGIVNIDFAVKSVKVNLPENSTLLKTDGQKVA